MAISWNEIKTKAERVASIFERYQKLTVDLFTDVGKKHAGRKRAEKKTPSVLWFPTARFNRIT